MSNSNRKITTEQFSIGTTIDGDRLDRALTQAQETYNKVPLSGFSALTSKQINWAMTPAMNIPFGKNAMGANTGYMYGWWLGGPLETCYDGGRNANQYLDSTIGNNPIQNNFTYKGSGKNVFTNPLDQNWTDFTQYKFLWAQTYYTDKPIIMKELSWMCMWDDGYSKDSVSVVPLPKANKYFRNDFMDALNVSGYEVYIAVDNNLGLENTVNRDIETRVWGIPAQNFMKVPFGNTSDVAGGMTYPKWQSTAYTGYGDIRPYPGLLPVVGIDSLPAGLHINLRNLEIPIHQNSRVKIALVLPRDTNLEWEKSNTVIGDRENPETPGKTPSPFTGMWSCSMTILEELKRE
jgi:hypothetical protein